MRYLHVALALAVVSIAMAQEPEEIVLPRPMGAINDYAAVLGGARQSLEEELQTIKENFHVQIVILATIYDPYDDPPRYAQEIWGFWKLGKDTVLLVFVKEQTKNQWAFALRLGDEVRERFSSADLERMQSGLSYLLERRRVKTAIEESVKALRAILEGSYGQPPPSVSGGRLLVWLWVVVGLAGLGGVALGVRALLQGRCPRCGARMRVYHTYSRQGARIAYRSCPRCGYSRLR
jgi:uncharacterized membrane protein YgcG